MTACTNGVDEVEDGGLATPVELLAVQSLLRRIPWQPRQSPALGIRQVGGARSPGQLARGKFGGGPRLSIDSTQR
jgi:hypothetical protein